MSSPLKTARDTIVTTWEALTPPSDTNVTYRLVRTLDREDGVIPRRGFYFTAPKSAYQTEMGHNFVVLAYDFEAIVRFSTHAQTFNSVFDDVSDEGALLMASINVRSSWGTGIRYVRATKYDRQDTDTGDIELIISLNAEIEESDGYT